MLRTYAHRTPLLLLAVVSSLLVAPLAHAVAQRTFVASFGADANPCSVASPCRSFATAIAGTAVSGEVIVLDSAGYGPVTITQSVTITAPPGVYAGIFVPSGTGVTINGSGIIVALRGLTVNGQGAGSLGIHFLQGSRLTVENCLVTNINGKGLYVESTNNMVFVTDSTFQYSAPGIEIAGGQATLERVRVENNANGGIRVQTSSSDPANVVVRDSVLSGNGQAGVIASTNAGDTANVSVERTTAMGSTNGFVAGGQGFSTMIIRDSTATENTQSGIVADSGGALTKIIVTGSTSSRNGHFGLEQANSAVLITLQNNTLELNSSGPTTGTITTATLK